MSKTATLLPREHGAYAQLGFPLATGLLLAPPPALSAWMLALAAVSFFLANEPLAILLGVRGRRVLDQVGRKARTRGVALVAAGVILGFLGLVLGWPAIWPSALLPALAGLALIPTVLTGRQKSIPGELLVVTAFSSLALLLAAASGADPGRGLAATLVWWISFALGTLEVHAIKARVKAGARSQWTRWGSPLASIMVLTGALLMALGQWGSPRWAGPAAALLPPTLAILVLTLVKVHPRHLKRVGWTLVGANALTLLGLLQGG